MEAKPIIIFDGVCNLCNSLVNFIIQRDKCCKLRFTPSQSHAGINIRKKYGITLMDFETIVFINNSVVFTKSEAIIEVARYLDGWWKFITFIKIFPSFLRDGLYSKIAKNRYNWFGKKEGCMVPSKDINNRFLI
tara:strand:+ start:943 stop:1344 length:402 start_codon:yes stop_codon:yes gene_type:complete